MRTSTRYIVRVDDVGLSRVRPGVDHGLYEFLDWWRAAGWGSEPIYLGVVPSLLTPHEITILGFMEAGTRAEICLHGWDHRRDVLAADDVRLAAKVLPNARCVIPPFNSYDLGTIRACKALGRPRRTGHQLPVLFGGRTDRGHHAHGEAPTVIDGVLHLSAEPALYGPARDLVGLIDEFPDPGYPVVVTLHWTEDANPAVAQEPNRWLRERLAGRMATVDEAWWWAGTKAIGVHP